MFFDIFSFNYCNKFAFMFFSINPWPQLKSKFIASTIGISCDVSRSGMMDANGGTRGYEVEQCCVFGIDENEHREIAKIGKIAPKYFNNDAHR